MFECASIILFEWKLVSECALYNIIKMRACMCLNALYMVLLKWLLVFVWMRFICYYYDGRLFLSECVLKYIIKIRASMCPNALYMILLKWEPVIFWMRFIWYYYNWRLHLSECALKVIIKMRAFFFFFFYLACSITLVQ